MTAEYSELLNIALNLHKLNEFENAKKIYEKLLGINPEDVNVLNLYGLLCLTQNDTKTAIDLLSRAMVLKKSAYIISNLAKAYYLSGDYNKAIMLYNKAANEEPNDDIFYSMAIAYKQLGNIHETINSYEKALVFNKENFSVLYNLANLYKELSDRESSLKYALRAELIKENDEDIQTLLASLFEHKKLYKKSIQHLEKAYSLNNRYIYLYNIAVLSSKLGDEKKAISYYLKVLNSNPNHIESLVNLSSLYRNTDKELALSYIKKAYELASNDEIVSLSIAQLYKDMYFNHESICILNKLLAKKESAEAYSLLGMNFMDIQEYQTALENYNKALAINPNKLDYFHGKAMALKYLGNFDDAKLLMEYVVNKGDKSIQSITTLGMMYLQEKNFDKGMQLYIRRSEDTKFIQIFKEKIWNKDLTLKNKIVLVYSDCGLGDTIMFARYIPILEKVANKVIIQTDKELVSILKENFPNITVVSKSHKKIDYDLVIPIMNLAYALNIDFDSIPFSDKYLSTEKNNLLVFSQEKKNVGIFYQGNKRVFKNRSIGYNRLSRVIDSVDANFYSFQLDNDEFEDKKVIKLKNYIKDYRDTASFLLNLDVLVTIDSSIAHMAGALGVKTFLLLPNTAEWRWFNDIQTTPWYKSITIIKQSHYNDWDDVINKLIEELS